MKGRKRYLGLLRQEVIVTFWLLGMDVEAVMELWSFDGEAMRWIEKMHTAKRLQGKDGRLAGHNKNKLCV